MNSEGHSIIFNSDSVLVGYLENETFGIFNRQKKFWNVTHGAKIGHEYSWSIGQAKEQHRI